MRGQPALSREYPWGRNIGQRHHLRVIASCAVHRGSPRACGHCRDTEAKGAGDEWTVASHDPVPRSSLLAGGAMTNAVDLEHVPGGRFLPSGDEAGTPTGDRAFRPDVQGLRAVAILLVLLSFTRAWELALGGLIAVSSDSLTRLSLRTAVPLHRARAGVAAGQSSLQRLGFALGRQVAGAASRCRGGVGPLSPTRPRPGLPQVRARQWAPGPRWGPQRALPVSWPDPSVGGQIVPPDCELSAYLGGQC